MKKEEGDRKMNKQKVKLEIIGCCSNYFGERYCIYCPLNEKNTCQMELREEDCSPIRRVCER